MSRGASRFPLSGALALVTGAGSGSGRATALALAERGEHVLAVEIDGEAAAKTAVDWSADQRPDAHALACDVADEVHTRWEPLHVLVNNAGVGMTGRLGDMSLVDWRWIRGINLDGVVHDQAEGRERVTRLVGRGHAPETVARAIVRAIEENRNVVPVGWEAKLGWWAHRRLPLAAAQAVAGRSV